MSERTGPSTAICAKCGLDLIHEGGWWQAVGGDANCEAGDYHVPAQGDGVGHDSDLCKQDPCGCPCPACRPAQRDGDVEPRTMGDVASVARYLSELNDGEAGG